MDYTEILKRRVDYVQTKEWDYGDTLWVGIRARGSEWSLLTSEEALALAESWIAKYQVKEYKACPTHAQGNFFFDHDSPQPSHYELRRKRNWWLWVQKNLL